MIAKRLRDLAITVENHPPQTPEDKLIVWNFYHDIVQNPAFKGFDYNEQRALGRRIWLLAGEDHTGRLP